MKKIVLILLLILSLQMSCVAKTGISFVYINGSNNNNEKMKNWYETGVKKLHPTMKKTFDENLDAQKYFLKNGNYFIQPKPVIFFWGYKSHEDLNFVESNLAISKGLSSWFAFRVRYLLTSFLHDAIWVQKYHNMAPVLDDLHNVVKAEYKKGNKVALFGYSAGSFITYEYLLTRTPYINVKDFFNKVDVPQSERDFAAEHPMKNTCMIALGQELSVFSASGHIIPNDDEKTFKIDYMHLDDLTDKYCIPDKAVRGIVNFASPLVLFYSDISDPNYQLTYYNRFLFKYLIENDMFWLTVNYREDPLGFPGGKNLSIDELENVANLNINPHFGFIYDQSDTRGRRPFFMAHTSYWATKKNFSKAVVKAYINGYKHQYDDEFKQKTVKKYEKKYNIMP